MANSNWWTRARRKKRTAAKFRDADQFGLSPIVPFIPDELPIERHRRRVESALANREAIRQWCEHRGIDHMVCGDTRHPHGWMFKFRVRFFRGAACAGWVPGLARAWRTANAGHGKADYARVYDWQQLILFLEAWASAATRQIQTKEGPPAIAHGHGPG